MAPITFNYNITKKDGLENKETWAPCDPRYIDQLIGGWMRAGKDMVALKRRSPLSVSAMRPIHPLLGGLERDKENITFDRSDRPEWHPVNVRIEGSDRLMTKEEIEAYLPEGLIFAGFKQLPEDELYSMLRSRLEQQLADATFEGEDIDESLPADTNVKNYSYTVVDGAVYFRETSRMVRPDLNATAEARVKGLVGLRDCVQLLIDLEMDAAAPDADIRAQMAELNRRYDDFSAKYGLINDRANRLAFADDSSYYLLCALEVLDEDGRLERKADMFTKRTIKPHEGGTTVDTASEALAVSIAE